MSSWHPSASSASDPRVVCLLDSTRRRSLEVWFTWIQVHPEKVLTSPLMIAQIIQIAQIRFRKALGIRGVYCRACFIIIIFSIIFCTFYPASSPPKRFEWSDPTYVTSKCFLLPKSHRSWNGCDWTCNTSNIFKNWISFDCLVWNITFLIKLPMYLGIRSFQTNPKIMLSRLHAIILPHINLLRTSIEAC